MFTHEQQDYSPVVPIPADALGFSLPAPLEPAVDPSGPISDAPRTLSAEEIADNLAEFIRQKALVNVDVLAGILTQRAVDPTASNATVQNALEANIKLSGITAKQIAKEVGAPTFSVQINIPSTLSTPARVVTAERVDMETTQLDSYVP